MRRGRDEGPARLLLVLKLLLHLVKGPGQVADLVPAALGGHLHGRTLRGELKRRLAESAQAPDDRARQRDAEDERQSEPGQGGV